MLRVWPTVHQRGNPSCSFLKAWQIFCSLVSVNSAVMVCYLLSAHFSFMYNRSMGKLASGPPGAVCYVMTFCQPHLCIRSVCLSAQFQGKVWTQWKRAAIVKILCSAIKVKANAGLEKKCVPNCILLYKILNTLNALVHEVRSMQKCSVLFAHSQHECIMMDTSTNDMLLL